MTTKTPPDGILPVLEKLKDTYKIWQEILPHVSKNHRQTIGAKIDVLILKILELSYRAAYASGATKPDLIRESIIHNDLAKFFLTVMWHCKIIDDKKYIRISKALVEIGKMLFGWKEFLENKNPLGQKSFGENA